MPHWPLQSIVVTARAWALPLASPVACFNMAAGLLANHSRVFRDYRGVLFFYYRGGFWDYYWMLIRHGEDAL